MSMDLAGYFRRMAGNNRWSNDRLHGAVLLLDDAAFRAPRTGFFPSIEATLNHILAIDLFYLDFLEEGGRGLAIVDGFLPYRTAEPLAEAQVEADRRLIDFCGRLGAGDLARRVATDRGEDGIVPERIDDLLGHLFLHQIHHRGQVHAMLSDTAVAPPQLDEFLLDYDLARRRDEMRRLELTEDGAR